MIKRFSFLPKLSGLLLITMLLPVMLWGQSLMYYWNFNDNVPGSNQNWQQPIPATIGTAEITYTFTEAFSFAGTTINGIDGEVNGGSLAPRGGTDLVNNGEYFTIAAPTTGYQDIVLTYPTRRTSTGFHTQQINYTTDGNTWLTKETIDISGFQNNWLPGQLVTINFSGIAGVDNNPDFAVRIILTGATTNAGNNRFDNIRISGSQIGAISPPTDFIAEAMSNSQIDLNWSLNSDNDPVLLAWSDSGTFGAPTGSYNAGDPIAGGGTVLYAGSNTSFSHQALNAGTTYYYAAWSNDGGDYSAGATANATTVPDPAFTALPYSETFDSDLGNCYTYSVSGPTRFWQHETSGGNGFAVMNGFNSGELEEDWLILPGIDMNDYSNVILNFETAWNFGEENDNNYLKLYYSTNYAGIGDPEDASWTDLEFVKPASGGYIWQSSGNIDLSGIQGVVWIGFKYHFSENYRRWQVDNIHIFEADSPILTAEPGVLSGFSYELGNGPSAEQSFAASGINLTGDISIMPSENFEISTESGAGFSATNPIIIPHLNGTVEPTTIYVRLKAGLEVGEYSNEEIVVSSSGAVSVSVNCSGSVTPEVTPPLSIDSPAFVYQQDFNTLASSGTGNPWTDNETIAGWYWQSPGDRDPNVVGYNASDGSSTAANATSFGASGNIDRAMGAISGSSNRDYYFGVQFRNNTGIELNLSEIYISYTGEQWRQTANEQTLAFTYKKSPAIITSLLTGTWTPNTNLDFTSPHFGTAGALNGNDPANSVVFSNIPVDIEGTLAPGEYIVIRWAKAGTTSPGLAIDDLIFSLVEIIVVDNPGNFSATAASTSEINLSWELNNNNDDVLIAWSADGVFGIPEGSYQAGDLVIGGGIVLYAGSNTSVNHENLEAGNMYYYKAWSVNVNNYSSGVAASTSTWPDPVFTTLPYNETFDTDLGDCYAYSASGPTKIWSHGTFEDNGYAWMNGFNSGDLEIDWLIIPGINFDIYENEVLTFDTWWRFGMDNENNYLKLFYSADYTGTGDPSSANWTEMEFTRPAEDQTWASSGSIDLSGVIGESVFIGFKYRYEPENYRSWQVDNISISGDPAVIVLPGDANCDGTVNVIDVITIVNYILGNNPQPFCFDNADVNGDGTVNVIDVIGTVNIILSNNAD